MLTFYKGWPAESWDYYQYTPHQLLWQKGIYKKEYSDENNRTTWKETATKTKVGNKIVISFKKIKVDNSQYGE